jgi:hypothetical protein
MIKYVNGRNHVVVNNHGIMPYISPGSQSAGMVRWNVNMNEMEVYDGVSWKQLSTSIDVGLDPEAEMILSWAREKMLEEQKLDELCKKYPGLDRARSNFETFLKLVQSEESIQSS